MTTPPELAAPCRHSSPGNTPTRERLWLRAGLLLLITYQAIVGGWQYFAPRSFYDDFPTVSLDPPYNVHFVSDIGGLGLSLAAIMAVATYYLEVRLVVVAMIGNIVYAGTHFAFHIGHFHDAFTGGEKASVAITLGAFAIIPVLLILLALRIERLGRQQ